MSFPISLPANGPLITLSHPKPSLWVIELHNGEDSRLSVNLLRDGLSPALDIVEKEWRNSLTQVLNSKDKSPAKAALIIVGKQNQDKFFSNGLEYESIVNDPNFFPLTFNPVLIRLLTFPIPCIAAINGHAFAGGFCLTMACDYRVMTDGLKRRAWLCMNEVHFGAPLPTAMASVFKSKLHGTTLRKITMEGHRFTPQEALAAGIIDEVVGGGTGPLLQRAEALADTVGANAQTGVWGLLKTELYREHLKDMRKDLRTVTPITEAAAFKSRL